MTKILIVEDESVVAWHIQEALESLEHTVVGIAASGEEAIQLAATTEPELVLMDIQLPGKMDGVAAAHTIYTRFSIPAIYLTAHADNYTLQRAMETNPFGYLLKPFQELELHVTIQIALQRHRQEQNLKAAQQYLDITLTSIGDATIATDHSGIITFINPVAEAFTGWQRQEALGKSINTVLPLINQETRETVENPIFQAMLQGSSVSLPECCLLCTKNGTEKPVTDTAAPIKNYQGEVIGSVLIFQDVSKQQHAQAKLEQQNQILEEYQLSLLTQLQELSTQLQQVKTCLQVLKHTTEIANNGWANSQILQLTIEELGRALEADYCWVALHDEEYAIATVTYEYISSDVDHRPSALGTQIDLQNHLDFYLPLFQKECWLSPPREILPAAYQLLLTTASQLLICPICEQQQVIGEVGILSCGKLPWSQLQAELVSQVITQSLLAFHQAHLDYATQTPVDELERLNNLKHDFISSVSHELRTPLTNMRMALEMFHHFIYLLKKADSLEASQTKQILWPKIDQYLQILQEEWQQEFQLISDLLKFQDHEILTEPTSLSIVDVQQWVPRITSRFREQAARQGQLFLYETSSQLPLVVPYLPSLERIVTELLNNACKFTPPKECIKIVITQTEGNLLVVEVTNTGIEIPSEELERIFQPFYRIPRPNPWIYGGTGLGLALVKKLALRLGGEVQVDSSNGKTTFIVILPLTR